MRRAAGIILIIWGILGLIGLVLNLTDSGIYLSLLFATLWRIGSGALLVTGGFFALRRGIGERAWLRPCLQFQLEFSRQLMCLGVCLIGRGRSGGEEFH